MKSDTLTFPSDLNRTTRLSEVDVDWSLGVVITATRHPADIESGTAPCIEVDAYGTDGKWVMLTTAEENAAELEAADLFRSRDILEADKRAAQLEDAKG